MSEIASHYPQGMGTYNNRSYIGGYTSWKGQGMYSNPFATTAGNIRPLTNKDYTNVTPGKHGLPRPMKRQYRKGTVTPDTNATIFTALTNTNRESKSSKSYSVIGQLIDRPGQFAVKHNPANEISETVQMGKDCKTCQGIGLVTDFYPEPYLTNNPEPVSTNTPHSRVNSFCCNQQKNALLRVRPASTNLKKNYYTTHNEYMQNRCQTYDQKAFNFYAPGQVETVQDIMQNNPSITQNQIAAAKPGSPLTLANLYIANCYPTTSVGETTQIELVMNVFQLMNTSNIFAVSEINAYYLQKIQTLQAFALFIQTIGKSAQAAEIFERFINNPYYGMAITGPSNPIGCKLVVYKPSNPQFAKEGGVTSSTRTLKLAVTTVEKNVYNNKITNAATVANLGATYTYSLGNRTQVPFIYKNKSPSCNPAVFTKNGNPTTCFRINDVANTARGNVTMGPTVANNGISTMW